MIIFSHNIVYGRFSLIFQSIKAGPVRYYSRPPELKTAWGYLSSSFFMVLFSSPRSDDLTIYASDAQTAKSSL